MTFAEAMEALAKGERVEANQNGSPHWWELSWPSAESTWSLSRELISSNFRLVPRKTRIQEMADVFRATDDGQCLTCNAFGERVVREVCKYLRGESAEPFARDVEREFLGGAL